MIKHSSNSSATGNEFFKCVWPFWGVNQDHWKTKNKELWGLHIRMQDSEHHRHYRSNNKLHSINNKKANGTRWKIFWIYIWLIRKGENLSNIFDLSEKVKIYRNIFYLRKDWKMVKILHCFSQRKMI